MREIDAKTFQSHTSAFFVQRAAFFVHGRPRRATREQAQTPANEGAQAGATRTLQVVHQGARLGVGGAAGFEEVGLNHVRVRELAHPRHALRLALVSLVQRLETQLGAAQVAKVLDVVGDHLLVEAGHVVADGVMAPTYLLLAAFLDHGAILLHQLGREQLRLLLLQFQQDVAEQPQVRVLIAVDIADLLHRPRHEVVAPQVVEEHEAAVEVHASRM